MKTLISPSAQTRGNTCICASTFCSRSTRKAINTASRPRRQVAYALPTTKGKTSLEPPLSYACARHKTRYSDPKKENGVQYPTRPFFWWGRNLQYVPSPEGRPGNKRRSKVPLPCQRKDHNTNQFCTPRIPTAYRLPGPAPLTGRP